MVRLITASCRRRSGRRRQVPLRSKVVADGTVICVARRLHGRTWSICSAFWQRASAIPNSTETLCISPARTGIRCAGSMVLIGEPVLRFTPLPYSPGQKAWTGSPGPGPVPPGRTCLPVVRARSVQGSGSAWGRPRCRCRRSTLSIRLWVQPGERRRPHAWCYCLVGASGQFDTGFSRRRLALGTPPPPVRRRFSNSRWSGWRWVHGRRHLRIGQCFGREAYPEQQVTRTGPRTGAATAAGRTGPASDTSSAKRSGAQAQCTCQRSPSRCSGRTGRVDSRVSKLSPERSRGGKGVTPLSSMRMFERCQSQPR